MLENAISVSYSEFQFFTNRVIFSLNTASEAVVRRCSLEEVFLEILRNSQENNCG